MEEQTTQKVAGVWSGFTCWLFFLLIALFSGRLVPFILEFLQFMTGGVSKITPFSGTSYLEVIPDIASLVAISYPISLGAIQLGNLVLGKIQGSHLVAEVLSNKGLLFRLFYISVLLEELFARYLFFGVLWKIPWFAHPIFFYLLMLIGNTIWSLFHLTNFRAEDQHPLRALPQFWGGFLLSFIYVQYGLLVTIIAHFTYNCVALSMHKVEKTNWVDGGITLYSAVIAFVSYTLMDQPLSEVALWFSVTNPVFALPGWDFWDYAKLLFFVTSGLECIFGLLNFDRTSTISDDERERLNNRENIIFLPILYLVFMIVAIALLVLGLTVVEWIFGVGMVAVYTTSILFSFGLKSHSGSSMSRVFLVTVPHLMISLCLLKAFGFWLLIGLSIVAAIVALPRTLLELVND